MNSSNTSKPNISLLNILESWHFWSQSLASKTKISPKFLKFCSKISSRNKTNPPSKAVPSCCATFNSPSSAPSPLHTSKQFSTSAFSGNTSRAKSNQPETRFTSFSSRSARPTRKSPKLWFKKPDKLFFKTCP